MTEIATPGGVAPATLDLTAEAEVPAENVEKRRLGFGFWLAIGWVVLIVLLALFAPLLPLKDPDANFIQPGEPPPYSPSAEHWFGTDQDARDMFSRTIFGARVSLVVGFVAIAAGMIIGGSLGMIAGFLRGPFDRIVSFVFLVLLSFPALVLAILITALLDRSLFTISVTLGILAIAPVGRLARAATLVFAEREFVMAARTIGAKPSRILVRELLPNVVIPMGALALLGMAVAIVAEGGLAFLGLSVEKGSTWGKLILNGSNSRILEDAPWVAFAPILVLFLTVSALNFAGDRLRDYFDVKELSL
jgi:peptide/nickel transport system permease protein